MRSLARVAAALAAVVAGVATLVAPVGWLYLFAPVVRLPGPTVGDGLPLDELSRHSAVPLLDFVLVWAAAALVLAGIARAFGASRLVAALLLGLFVGSGTYVSSAVSILIVRQIAAEDAFRDAATLRVVAIPTLLAAAAGALLADSGKERRRGRLVLACFTAAAGSIGVLDSLFPEHNRTLLGALAPGVRPLASALLAPLGLALVYVSPGLARGSRRAWQLAVALLACATALHVAHSDYGAFVTGALAACLLARRGDFRRLGDPTAAPRLALRLVLFLMVVYAYGTAALWANRLMADRPFSFSFALRETTTALIGGTLRGSAHLAGPFGDWFGPSVFALGLACAAALIVAWLAPWRYRLEQDVRVRELVRGVVDKWGSDTLAPFVLRGDKSYFLDAEERALVAYRVVGGVAVVSGDPLGPPEALDELVAAFIEHTRARGWRVCILGASERCLELYRRHGLHALYHGDEAVLDVASFSLEGRAIRKVRQSVSRLHHAGYTSEVVWAAELQPELRLELETIAREWRGVSPTRGFTMALDQLFRLDGDQALFVLGRSPDGAVQGFLHFAVLRRGAALSLSSMPRRRTTPNGFNEWLVCETVDWARRNGFERISLNFAPFAALLAPGAQLTGAQRLERRALLATKGWFQLDNLLLFNRKFLPSWQRRFVVYEHRLDLPRIGFAALAAESYLPFAGKGAS